MDEAIVSVEEKIRQQAAVRDKKVCICNAALGLLH